MPHDKFTTEEFRDIVGRWERSSQRDKTAATGVYSNDEVSTALRELGATDEEVSAALTSAAAEPPEPPSHEAALRAEPVLTPSQPASEPLPFVAVATTLVLPFSILVLTCSFATRFLLAFETEAMAPALKTVLEGVDHVLGPWVRLGAIVGIALSGLAFVFSER